MSASGQLQWQFCYDSNRLQITTDHHNACCLLCCLLRFAGMTCKSIKSAPDDHDDASLVFGLMRTVARGYHSKPAILAAPTAVELVADALCCCFKDPTPLLLLWTLLAGGHTWNPE
jgi:hypothetical protein